MKLLEIIVETLIVLSPFILALLGAKINKAYYEYDELDIKISPQDYRQGLEDIVYNYIRRCPGVTPEEIAESLGTKIKVIKNILMYLKQNEKVIMNIDEEYFIK